MPACWRTGSVLGGTMEFCLRPVKAFTVIGLAFYLVELGFKNAEGWRGLGAADRRLV